VNSGSATDEYGNIFQLPVPIRVKGAYAFMDLDAGGDTSFVLYDSDGSTALESVSIDGDLEGGGGEEVVIAQFTTAQSLLANTNYRMSIRPDTTTNVGIMDFTVNAVALKLKPEWLTQNLAQPQRIPSAWILTEADFELIDPHHGLADLAARKLRTVGSAQERFAEDALRMLRAIRLSVQLNFEIDSETLTAISHQAELLRHVSFERIRDEGSDRPSLQCLRSAG